MVAIQDVKNLIDPTTYRVVDSYIRNPDTEIEAALCVRNASLTEVGAACINGTNEDCKFIRELYLKGSIVLHITPILPLNTEIMVVYLPPLYVYQTYEDYKLTE
jgi:hypothetical protein